MNTQLNKYGTFILFVVLMLGLLSGCVSPVQAATAPATSAIDTCVGHSPLSKMFLVIMIGTQPGDEQALGDDVTCYDSQPGHEKYWVVEKNKNEPRSVIPTGGVSTQILEMMMDSSNGGYAR